MKITFYAFVINVFLVCNTYAQVSIGGQPLSNVFSVSPQDEIASFEISKPNMEMLRQEDQQDEEVGRPPRYASLLPAGIDVLRDGSWENLPNGDRLCRMRIQTKDALGLALLYDRFYLPPMSRLFIYTPDRSEVLGAFTSLNNKQNGVFATGNLAGNSIIIEYYEPASSRDQGIIHISEVAYVYRLLRHPHVRSSDICDIDVACSPESDNWQDQIRGAVRISVVDGGSAFWCSGSLINNTAQDCTPYILTALHCGEGSTPAEFGQYIFYFNYQNNTCGGGGASSAQSITGCQKTADSDDGGGATGSDYLLVEITSNIPAGFNVFYNGWNAENSPSPDGVSIHHPGGEPKKISTYTTTLQSATWGGNPGTHWQVFWAVTANGQGVTSGGSSGSPIFNNTGLIVGQLTGGSSFCSSPNNPDFYGKMSYNWDSNPGDDLKDWLDPTNSGVLQLNGTNAPCGMMSNPPVAAFTSTFAPPVCPNDVITFVDLSTNNPTNWLWDFGDGNTSTLQSPTHSYTTSGTYDVSLTVSNADGMDTHTEIAYITILAAPLASFSQEVIAGNNVIFTDESTEAETWNWDFGDGNNSTMQHPVHNYSMPGSYTVTLTVTNDCGVDMETKVVDIQTDLPGADFSSNISSGCAVMEVEFVNESSANSDSFNWFFEGGMPNMSTGENPIVEYVHAGTYLVMLIATNSSGADTLIAENYIHVNAPPTALFNFQMDQTEISFNNTSIDADSFHWDFGDGNQSDTIDPVNVYPGNGSYIVRLTAFNSCGHDIYMDTIVIDGALPVATFETLTDTICLGDSLFLMDRSSGAPTAWWWSVAGASPELSTDQHPTFIFDSTGTYAVQLIIQNSFGFDTTAQDHYIEVIDQAFAHYSYTTNGLEVSFINESIFGVDYLWRFGDGDSSTVANPVHIFPSPGQYVVELIARNQCGGILFGQSVQVMLSGLEDQSGLQDINIFPNPSSGGVYIQFNGNPADVVTVGITNSQGQRILIEDHVFSSGEFLGFVDLVSAPGLYIISLTHGDEVIFRKLIVE